MKSQEERLSDLEAALDSLMAAIAGMQSDAESVLDMFSLIAANCGWNEERVASALELRRRKSAEKLQEILINIENANPGYAAKLQALIDERRKPKNPN